MKKERSEWTHPIVLHTAVALMLTLFVARPMIIPTDSMEPTINVPTVTMGYNIHLSEIKHGSLIAFKFTEEDGKKRVYCKRVIGLPGDTVQIIGEKVIVNGEELKEDYLAEPMCPYDSDYMDYDIDYEKGESKNGLHFYDFEGNEIRWKYRPTIENDEEDPLLYYEADRLMNKTYEVPEDCYFVLGDNRNNSFDSREWENPYVNKKDLRYKVILQAWPIKVFEGGN